MAYLQLEQQGFAGVVRYPITFFWFFFNLPTLFWLGLSSWGYLRLKHLWGNLAKILVSCVNFSFFPGNVVVKVSKTYNIKAAVLLHPSWVTLDDIEGMNINTNLNVKGSPTGILHSHIKKTIALLNLLNCKYLALYIFWVSINTLHVEMRKLP